MDRVRFRMRYPRGDGEEVAVSVGGVQPGEGAGYQPFRVELDRR